MGAANGLLEANHPFHEMAISLELVNHIQLQDSSDALLYQKELSV